MKSNISLSTNGERLIISDYNTNNGYFSIYKIDKPHNNLWIKINLSIFLNGQKLGKFVFMNGNSDSVIVADNNEKIYKYKFAL